MARMYAKVRGSSLNSRVRQDGKFRSNASIGVEVDIDAIAKVVYRDVMKTIKSGEPKKVNKMNESDVESPLKKKAKGRKNWHTSVVGGTMLASQIVSSSVGLQNAWHSGDRAELAQQTYTSAKGMGTLLLSTFGGPIGMVATVLINRIEGTIGQAIKNQIQLQYDNSRLQYNMTKYDIGRFSTYTYDYEKNKWIAKDDLRVRNNILNQTT